MTNDLLNTPEARALEAAIGYDTITASFPENGIPRAVTTYMAVEDRDRIVTSILASDFIRHIRREAFNEGRTAVISYAAKHVQDDEPFEGFIDQHIVVIGGSKIRNPHETDEERAAAVRQAVEASA